MLSPFQIIPSPPDPFVSLFPWLSGIRSSNFPQWQEQLKLDRSGRVQLEKDQSSFFAVAAHSGSLLNGAWGCWNTELYLRSLEKLVLGSAETPSDSTAKVQHQNLDFTVGSCCTLGPWVALQIVSYICMVAGTGLKGSRFCNEFVTSSSPFPFKPYARTLIL